MKIRDIKIRAAKAFSASFSPPSSDPLFGAAEGNGLKQAKSLCREARHRNTGDSLPKSVRVRAPSKIRQKLREK